MRTFIIGSGVLWFLGWIIYLADLFGMVDVMGISERFEFGVFGVAWSVIGLVVVMPPYLKYYKNGE